MKIKITGVENKPVKIKYPCLLKYGSLYAIATSEYAGIRIDGNNISTMSDDDEGGESWSATGFRPTEDSITFN